MKAIGNNMNSRLCLIPTEYSTGAGAGERERARLRDSFERMYAMSRETAELAFLKASLHERKGRRLRPEFTRRHEKNRRCFGEYYLV